MAIKKCKGNGKARGFGCGTPLSFSEFNGIKSYNAVYGLGKKCGCYNKWLLDSEEGNKKLQDSILKVTAQRKEITSMLLDKKAERSLNKLLLNVRMYCHEYIRLRDKGKPCISCGAKWSSNFQAGHFYKAELYSSLRFNELNVNGQCQKCNIRLDGNFIEYRKGITKRWGKDVLPDLDLLALEYKRNNFKWNKATLIESRETFKEKLKILKKKY